MEGLSGRSQKAHNMLDIVVFPEKRCKIAIEKRKKKKEKRKEKKKVMKISNKIKFAEE